MATKKTKVVSVRLSEDTRTGLNILEINYLKSIL